MRMRPGPWGALYVRNARPAVKLIPLIDGGGQERGRRSGTQNVPGIIGFGKACEVASRVMAEEAERLTKLRGRLKAGVLQRIDGVYLNGHPGGGAGSWPAPASVLVSDGGAPRKRSITLSRN